MILAVDGGIASLGYAVLRHGTAQLVEIGVIMQPRNPALGEHEDRHARVRHQARTLTAIARARRCDTLAAEELSFGGPPKARLQMALSLGLCWGSLEAIAALLEMRVVPIPPKSWQRGVHPEAGTKVDYDVVFERIRQHVGDHPGLRAVKQADRNHAYDAFGVGCYVAVGAHLA